MDPVTFELETLQWWFFDETWTERHGPFGSEAEAREGLRKYARWLDTGEVEDEGEIGPDVSP